MRNVSAKAIEETEEDIRGREALIEDCEADYALKAPKARLVPAL